ncbi:MAG TPA: hypothetical protein VGF95_14385 [Solirubrobacteraceae bacterium]|jgi:hypothetical protein
MDDWTCADLAAALRAEIERDTRILVRVSDEKLLYAAFEPLLRARRRVLEAQAAIAEPTKRATAAVDALCEQLRRLRDLEVEEALQAQCATLKTNLLRLHDSE